MDIARISYKSFLLQYIGWWLGWIVIQTLVLHLNADIPVLLAAQDAAITNIVLGLAGYELIIVMRHYQPRQSLRFIWSVVLALACAALIRWLLLVTVTDGTYLNFVDKWIAVRAVFAWLMLSFITAVSWMWFYIHEQQELQLRNADMEKLAREAELTMLRQQLQPHFLFNSLNSISALAGSQPEAARRMIQQLSDFLRGTIKRDDQSMILLQDEVEHLELYLEIEKVRFGHRLKTTVNRTPETSTMKLPALILQPIVENAIKFGLYDTVGEIIITLDARMEHGYLHLTVTNPYDPETAQPRKGTGFGLTSIQRRLYLLFGRNDLLSTKQVDSTFHTEVRIPQL